MGITQDVYKRQDESGYEVLVVKKFSIGEYIKTATAIVANMIEAL